MYRLVILIPVLILLLLTVSCNTNPPTDTDGGTLFGQVYVYSNVDGAAIFVDGFDSGYLTPDTLTLEAGPHDIEVRKNGYSSLSQSVTVEPEVGKPLDFDIEELAAKKVVLIEDFANVSCEPCVYSNAILKSVREEYGSDNVVIIKYPTNFPSPSDPFYLANPEDANSRINFYQIFAAPTVIVDGDERPIATDEADIKEKLDQKLLDTPGISIDVADSVSGYHYISIVSVDFNSNIQNTEDYDLFISVTENNISYDTPPGSNGETEFNHVMRKIHKIDLADSGDDLNVEKVTQINAGWQIQNLSTIVFIQNKINKAVIQANSSE